MGWAPWSALAARWWPRQVLAGWALALAAVVGWAEPASAHAEVVDATPAPGSGLPQAPGAVAIKFTEPLNYDLSRIEVADDDGRSATSGPSEPVRGDPRAMRRKLGLLRPGAYTVRWTTVSTLDGHTLRGSYRFGVGTAPPGGQTVRDSPLASEGWAGLAGRFVALGGLVVWSGCAFAGGLAVRAGLGEARLALLRRIGPRLALGGASVAALSSAMVASGSLASVPDVLLGSPSGRWRAVVIAAAAVASLPGWTRRGVDPLLASVALVGEAASGHAAASPAPVVATMSFALHLGAVGVWLFAMASSVLAGEGVVRALAVMSPYAVVAAGVVGLTGLGNAALELSEPGDLFHTAYGLTLFAKVVAFTSMAAIGLIHSWARRRPRPDVADVAQPLQLELAVGVVALALATVLVGFPNPPREEKAASRLTGVDPVLSQLRGRDALAVADASGPFVVGMTLLPPRPGRVEVRLQVMGSEPGDALGDARVQGASGDGGAFTAELTPCGAGCFRGQALVPSAGTWKLEGFVRSNRGPITTSHRLPLPAPDGDAVLERALASMEALRTAWLREDLRAAEDAPPTVSLYAFRAPDAYRFETGGSVQITLGQRVFRREEPTKPWAESEGPPFTWPKGNLRAFWGQRAAARLVGTEEAGGVRSQVVAFVRPELPAWFRVWVGEADGLVRRQEMLAEGHVMHHTYGGFNEPVDIAPPPM